MNGLANITSKQLRRAADLKERIDNLRQQLERILGPSVQTTDGAVARKRRRMSRTGRAAIAAAARVEKQWGHV